MSAHFEDTPNGSISFSRYMHEVEKQMRSNLGIPCTEAHLFAEMACAANDDDPEPEAMKPKRPGADGHGARVVDGAEA